MLDLTKKSAGGVADPLDCLVRHFYDLSSFPFCQLPTSPTSC